MVLTTRRLFVERTAFHIEHPLLAEKVLCSLVLEPHSVDK